MFGLLFLHLKNSFHIFLSYIFKQYYQNYKKLKIRSFPEASRKLMKNYNGYYLLIDFIDNLLLNFFKKFKMR